MVVNNLASRVGWNKICPYSSEQTTRETIEIHLAAASNIVTIPK